MKAKHLAAALLLLAATGGTALADGAADGLAGSEWGLAGVDDAFVRFGAEGRISGKSFCNRFTGSYRLDEPDRIEIGALASTRMACPGEAMEKERDFLEKLGSARSYGREGTGLRLADADGRMLLELRQRDAD